MKLPWDASLKKLIRANPQAFTSLFVPHGQFVNYCPEALKSWSLEVDTLLTIVVNGERMLLHVEFQTYHDATMSERLLRYNVLARCEYHIPVLSCVVYLLKDGHPHPPPLNWTIPTGQRILQFSFEQLELGELAPEDLIHQGEVGLLPLLPLTKGGAEREVVQWMLTELQEAQHEELAVIGYTLASLMLKRTNAGELDWLIKRFHQMHDLLRETPIYQEILQEGLEQGIERGIEQGIERGIEQGIERGIEQGRLEVLHQTVRGFVRTRFPALEALSNDVVTEVKDTVSLQQMLFRLFQAQTEAEAKRSLQASSGTGASDTFQA